MGYKISVIVPIYNAGEKLQNCIDSLVNQTLDEIQLIFILDNPTDGSDLIVKKYSNLDNVIIHENKNNQHIGISRNIGLQLAEGKYIGFCDHDDICAPNMFETLYNIMENSHSDIVYSPYVIINEKSEIIYSADYDDSRTIDAKNLYLSLIGLCDTDSDFNRKLFLPKTIWNRLYKTDIIRENGITFIDTKQISPEDTIFNIEYSAHVKKASFCHDKLYFHVVHSNNTADSIEYTSLDKYLKGYNYLYNYFKKNNILDKDNISHRLANTIRFNVYSIARFCLIQQGVVYTYKLLKRHKQNELIKFAYKDKIDFVFTNQLGIKTRILNYLISQILK